MHFHLPRPLHGWREFAGEVGIIVIGVLIALGAESLIEDFRWRHQVSVAENGLKEEFGQVAINSYERLILQPCIMTRLSDLGTKLVTSKGEWKGTPQIHSVTNKTRRALLWVYIVPNRPLITETWDNAVSSGTLNHMPQDRVLNMATMMSQYRQFYELQEEEAKTAAQLMPLAYDVKIGSDKRLEMLSAVGDIDRINSLMTVMASQMLESIRSLHLGFTPAEIEEARRDFVKQTRVFYGSCVVDKPLSF